MFANDNMGWSSTRCSQQKSSNNIVTAMGDQVCVCQLIRDSYIQRQNSREDEYIIHWTLCSKEKLKSKSAN